MTAAICARTTRRPGWEARSLTTVVRATRCDQPRWCSTAAPRRPTKSAPRSTAARRDRSARPDAGSRSGRLPPADSWISQRRDAEVGQGVQQHLQVLGSMQAGPQDRARPCGRHLRRRLATAYRLATRHRRGRSRTASRRSRSSRSRTSVLRVVGCPPEPGSRSALGRRPPALLAGSTARRASPGPAVDADRPQSDRRRGSLC